MTKAGDSEREPSTEPKWLRSVDPSVASLLPVRIDPQLGVDELTAYYLEIEADPLAAMVTVFRTSNYPDALSAEIRGDGAEEPHVLIRAATPEEAAFLMQSDDGDVEGSWPLSVSEYHEPHERLLTAKDVRDALDFLVAVEPDPPLSSREEYEAAIMPFRPQVKRAMATLQGFALQAQPLTLERMQSAYYGFANDPRYLASALVSSVVTGSLNQAWNGVGPWRR